MANEYENRNRYGRGDDRYEERNSGRDWTDKAGDEVRSWMGDDRAERRRDMDEVRENRDRTTGGYRNTGSERPTGMSGAYASTGYGRSYEDDGYRRASMGGGMDGRSGRSYGGPSAGRADPAYGRNAGYGRDDRRYSPTRDYGSDEERGFFERAGDEVASWFGDEDAARRREEDSRHRGRGPKGYVRSDDRIKEDVSERLMDDGHLDASDIEVSVQDGEVTLSGTVSERFAKRHAEDIAERASGVKHVQNNLRVAPTGGASMVDTDPAKDRSIF